MQLLAYGTHPLPRSSVVRRCCKAQLSFHIFPLCETRRGFSLLVRASNLPVRRTHHVKRACRGKNSARASLSRFPDGYAQKQTGERGGETSSLASLASTSGALQGREFGLFWGGSSGVLRRVASPTNQCRELV